MLLRGCALWRCGAHSDLESWRHCGAGREGAHAACCAGGGIAGPALGNMPLTTEPRTAEARCHRERIAAVMESVAQVASFTHFHTTRCELLEAEHSACGRLPVCCTGCFHCHSAVPSCVVRFESGMPQQASSSRQARGQIVCNVVLVCAEVWRAAQRGVFARLYHQPQAWRPLVLYGLLRAHGL